MFFVRHNGGSVWFDELGHPWPKHECFDDDRYGINLRQLLTDSRQVFGVIIETETTRPGEGGRIMVRCSDGTVIDQEFDTTANLSLLPGRLVMVVNGERGELSLEFVTRAKPRVITYLRVVEAGTSRIVEGRWVYDGSRLVEEFAYRRRHEAEKRLKALQSQCPGRFWLEIDKRLED